MQKEQHKCSSLGLICKLNVDSSRYSPTVGIKQVEFSWASVYFIDRYIKNSYVKIYQLIMKDHIPTPLQQSFFMISEFEWIWRV